MSDEKTVSELIAAMRSNGGHLIPDVPICYVLTELALEHLAELELYDREEDGQLIDRAIGAFET
jgi:hypothetical protein